MNEGSCLGGDEGNGVHNEGTKKTKTNEGTKSSRRVHRIGQHLRTFILDSRKVPTFRVVSRLHASTAMLTDPFDTNRITSTIIGCAIRVHRATGPGLLESAYAPCLVYELRQVGFPISLQHPIPLVYRGIELETSYRADMLVEDLVLVELKSVESLASIHTAQMLTYLKLLKKPRAHHQFQCSGPQRWHQTSCESGIGEEPAARLARRCRVLD
jgi:GxxExxY protein